MVYFGRSHCRTLDLWKGIREANEQTSHYKRVSGIFASSQEMVAGANRHLSAGFGRAVGLGEGFSPSSLHLQSVLDRWMGA